MRPYYEEPGITIYHGDCKLLAATFDQRAYAVITDPPYGIQSPFAHGPRRRTSSLVWAEPDAIHLDPIWTNVTNDDHPFDPSPWLGFKQIILWGGNHYADQLPAKSKWLVWDKKPEMASDNQGDCELAWTNLPGSIRRFTHLWRGLIRAGQENVVNGPKLHPCQKPIALLMWCVRMTTLPIIDPYMGVGTTLVAAKELNRRAIGIEIEERYCEIAVNRLRQGVLPLAIGE